MVILDGKKVAQKVENIVKDDVKDLSKQGVTPGLAVILVGNNGASEAYVRMKAKACDRVGIYNVVHRMPDNISQDAILKTIDMMNQNPNIDGILVQLPLPKHIDTSVVLEAIDPKKDVDGFHPYNVGRVVIGLDSFVPATPYGVIKLLEEYNIDVCGKDVCIVGASNIVGKPLLSLLLNKNATVDICHIYTKDLKSHTLKADIICVGVGKVGLIREDMVKEGAIVIDIGINRLDNGKIVGDVDFYNVSKKTSFITPVPGGVGPMTISMLLENTIKAAKMRK